MVSRFAPALMGLVFGLIGSVIFNLWPFAELTPSISQILETPSDEERVIRVVEEANPAVVSIVISQDVPVFEQYFEQLKLPFGSFQIRVPRTRQSGTETVEVGSGSGFFISEDGYVVTNLHVISNRDAQYTIFTNDGVSYDASVAGVNQELDVAVLKVDATGFSFLTFGDSDTLEQGQTVVAIGNALGEFRNTVSVGVVSGLSRTITAALGFGRAEVLEDVIQTDAAINSGNSGGPLLDLNGEVIGVNVATSTEGENISFALPSTAVQVAVQEIVGF